MKNREKGVIPTYQLVSQKKYRLQGELAVTEIEQVFETGAEEVEDHGIIVAFRSEPSNERNTNTAGKSLIDLALILKLGMLGLDRFELDGNLLTGYDVDTEVDIT